ncbi:hypothetical protein JCM15765_12180 [Paradesulfitobacterium aromaticivorans]
MGFRLVFTKQAVKDKQKLEQAGLWNKTKALLKTIRENPREKPVNKLVGDYQGLFSKRLNIKHRIVYEIHKEENIIKVVSMWNHYDDN